MSGGPPGKASLGNVGPGWHQKLFSHSPCFCAESGWSSGWGATRETCLSPRMHRVKQGAGGPALLPLVCLTPAQAPHTSRGLAPRALELGGPRNEHPSAPGAAGWMGRWFLTASC